MKWADEQRNDVVNQAMDLATNVDRFRQVVILTMTHEGTFCVVQKRTDDATNMEAIGMYRLLAADTEQQAIAMWVDNERPQCEADE